METENLDEMLSCAIRERGIMDRMEQLDRRRGIVRRRIVRVACAFAACLVLFVCTDLTLGRLARNAVRGFDPATLQRGGNAVTALMAAGRNAEALALIGECRKEVSEPDELEELDFLEAVCQMRKGRYFKPKNTLKAIAAGEGPRSADAEALLEKL